MHTPVLLDEVIASLQVKKNGLYIDATVGEAGHLNKIIELGGKVLAIDWDEKQIQNLCRLNRDKIHNLKNAIFINGNFTEIGKIAQKYNFLNVDGVLFDLGLSINQINNSGRGFSYKKTNELIDMRLNQRIDKTGHDLINSLTQEQLYEIFTNYSEEINSWSIAKNIVRARNINKIMTVGDLINVIDKSINKRDYQVYARIFQAIRIAVNDELNNLKKGLAEAVRVLNKNGRIVIITYHSLEDRLVKNFIKNNKLNQINKKIFNQKNRKTFERSAKIRVINLSIC